MARIEAVELVAHAVACDNLTCQRVEVVRNAQSRPKRWFNMTLRRDFDKMTASSGELWFCSKDCLVDSMQWQLSDLVNRQQKPC